MKIIDRRAKCETILYFGQSRHNLSNRTHIILDVRYKIDRIIIRHCVQAIENEAMQSIDTYEFIAIRRVIREYIYMVDKNLTQNAFLYQFT